jgi:hypothetical protein
VRLKYACRLGVNGELAVLHLLHRVALKLRQPGVGLVLLVGLLMWEMVQWLWAWGKQGWWGGWQ